MFLVFENMVAVVFEDVVPRGGMQVEVELGFWRASAATSCVCRPTTSKSKNRIDCRPCPTTCWPTLESTIHAKSDSAALTADLQEICQVALDGC